MPRFRSQLRTRSCEAYGKCSGVRAPLQFDRGKPSGYHTARVCGASTAKNLPCRSTLSATCSASRPSARAMGRRSAAWSTAARRALR